MNAVVYFSAVKVLLPSLGSCTIPSPPSISPFPSTFHGSSCLSIVLCCSIFALLRGYGWNELRNDVKPSNVLGSGLGKLLGSEDRLASGTFSVAEPIILQHILFGREQ